MRQNTGGGEMGGKGIYFKQKIDMLLSTECTVFIKTIGNVISDLITHRWRQKT